MSEYIERDTAIMRITEVFAAESVESRYTAGRCIGILQTIPSSSVRLQTATEWIEERVVHYNKGGKPYTSIYHRCKACGYRNKRSKGWNTKFCPNCGAERI